jgi:hypothetical protein
VKISVAFVLESDNFISMRHTIINTQEGTYLEMDCEADQSASQALAFIGFYLKRSDGKDLSQDSDEIKEFVCVDWSDYSVVFKFLEGWYENACLKALTELGYSVEEADQPENVIQFSF